MWNVCVMHAECMRNVCVMHVECMWNVCVMHAECMWNVCVMHVECMWNACGMHVVVTWLNRWRTLKRLGREKGLAILIGEIVVPQRLRDEVKHSSCTPDAQLMRNENDMEMNDMNEKMYIIYTRHCIFMSTAIND